MDLDLTPSPVSLGLYAGDDYAFRLTLSDGSGVPISVTGTVDAQIRQHRLDPNPLQTFNVDLSQAAFGEIVLSLTGTQTQALLAGAERFSGVWDAQWTRNTGLRTLAQGGVQVTADVTRP